MNHHVIIGRLVDDPEDTARAFNHVTKGEAIALFKSWMEQTRGSDDILINNVLSSTAEIVIE